MALPNWPAPHVTMLHELLASGAPFSEIAISINRKFGTSYSRNACIGKAKRLGLSKTNNSPRVARTRVRNNPAKVREVRATRVKFTPAAPMTNEAGIEIKLRDAPVQPLHIGLLELTGENCHYPYGTDHFTFCGQKHLEGFPYCAPHVALTTKG
jgi:GcrA cell cycle regulator